MVLVLTSLYQFVLRRRLGLVCLCLPLRLLGPLEEWNTLLWGPNALIILQYLGVWRATQTVSPQENF